MRSSYYYFVDPKHKEYLYKDLYEDRAKEQGITMKQVLANEFEIQIENYKTHSTEDDVVITEINDILKYDVYEEVCNKLQLVINKENYNKCKVLFENRSHL
jgi:triacylglycerol esterase/lipase EstA (alpha/beta hydrolase family)